MRKTHLIALLLLGVQLFFLANLQFTAWPEMFSYAYLRNHGFLLYKDMIHPYPPILTMGLSWIYSLIGYNLWVLQTVAWSVILASSVLVFLITRYVTKSNKFALASLTVYVLLQPFLEGNMLWFDLAIIPPILLGLLFLLGNNLFLAGLFLGIAILTKQTAGLFLLFAFCFLLFAKRIPLNRLKSIFYGPLILGIPFLVRLIQEGASGDFINWVLIYPLTKWGSIIGYVQMELSLRQTLVIILLFFPLVAVLVKKWIIFKNDDFRILILFLLVSLIAVYPRFSFFHFQTAIAILVILYAYLFSQFKVRRLTIVQCLLSIALVFFLVHLPVISRDWGKEARFYGNADLQLAKIISEKTVKNDRVFLLGLNSSLYTMSDRLPPERWTDNFSWYLEIPGVQEEIISRWKDDPAKFVFWRTPSAGNQFDLGSYQPQKIVPWIEGNYTKKEEIKPGIWLWERRLVLSE